MKIYLSFYGNLIIYRRSLNELKRAVELPGDTSVSGLLNKLGISKKQVKIACNGKDVTADYVLKEDDYLQLYSLFSGG